jgi:hypothetical protein
MSDSQANHRQRSKKSKAHWWILGAFLLAMAIVLPMSWAVIQAELRQGRNMKAMQSALKVLKQQPCNQVEAQAQWLALKSSVDNIPYSFPKLHAQFEFRRHQLDLAAAVRDSTIECSAIPASVGKIEQGCKACHKEFRSSS